MIFFLGPLPPPVHGFSVINQKMLARLSEKSEVHVFNTSSGVQSATMKSRILFRMSHWLRRFSEFSMLAFIKRPDALYVGLSGGAGQLFDMLYILIARLSGANIFLHHHSFVYLNAAKPYNRLCLWIAGRGACHIALCDVMAEKLLAVYGIPNERIFVLSNAAFLDDGIKPHVRRRDRTALTLGFISNIILEKGIVEFFDVVDSLVQQGYPVKGRVAGPVDAGLQETFAAMLKERPEIEYAGPVYDKDKEAYFHSIDLLLFPTKYRNEAEPLTILEALRQGIPVLAADRGCIRSMVNAQSGMVFPEIDRFVPEASEYIKSVLNGTNTLQALSENAWQRFERMRDLHTARLDELLDMIAAAGQLPKPVQA